MILQFHSIKVPKNSINKKVLSVQISIVDAVDVQEYGTSFHSASEVFELKIFWLWVFTSCYIQKYLPRLFQRACDSLLEQGNFDKGLPFFICFKSRVVFNINPLNKLQNSILKLKLTRNKKLLNFLKRHMIEIFVIK